MELVTKYEVRVTNPQAFSVPLSDRVAASAERFCWSRPSTAAGTNASTSPPSAKTSLTSRELSYV
jgi:hypothetical protein